MSCFVKWWKNSWKKKKFCFRTSCQFNESDSTSVQNFSPTKTGALKNLKNLCECIVCKNFQLSRTGEDNTKQHACYLKNIGFHFLICKILIKPDGLVFHLYRREIDRSSDMILFRKRDLNRILGKIVKIYVIQ